MATGWSFIRSGRKTPYRRQAGFGLLNPSMGNDHGQQNDWENQKWNRRQVVELLKIVDALVCLNKTALEISSKCGKGRRASGFTFTFGLPKQKRKGHMPIEKSITTEQEITVTLSPKTDTDKPAKLDGSPTWVTISGNAQIVVAEDGLSADLISSDDPGDTVFMVKADADVGAGVEELSDTITLHSLGATAKNLGLTASEPRPKRTLPPPA